MPIIRHTNRGAHSGASVTCWAAFCANRNRTGMTATASVCHGSWQRCRVELQLALRSRDQIEQDHVAPRHQLAQDFQSLRSAEIERDALLATVDAQEPERFVAQEGRPPSACVVARLGLLHLHDGSAQIGKQLAGIRTGDRRSEVEDSYSGEQVERGGRPARQAVQGQRGISGHWREFGKHCTASCKLCAMPSPAP